MKTEKSTDYKALLDEKMREKYQDFIDELKKMEPDELLSHCYEKVYKEQLVEIVANKEMEPIEAQALYRLRNPLNDLYTEWLKDNSSDYDILCDVVDERTKSAIEEMEMRTASSEGR